MSDIVTFEQAKRLYPKPNNYLITNDMRKIIFRGKKDYNNE